VVGLADIEFRNALDDLLTAATEPSERLMNNVFVTSNISPLHSQPATFGFGAVYLFTIIMNLEIKGMTLKLHLLARKLKF